MLFQVFITTGYSYSVNGLSHSYHYREEDFNVMQKLNKKGKQIDQ